MTFRHRGPLNARQFGDGCVIGDCDGKVHAVHAGFVAKASGEYNAGLKREVADTVEHLLSENVVASR